MTSDYEAQRFALMQAVSEQVILPSQLKALYPNTMMSDRHGQLPILGQAYQGWETSHTPPDYLIETLLCSDLKFRYQFWLCRRRPDHKTELTRFNGSLHIGII